MSALLFTACTWAEVTPEPIEKQKPKETVVWDSNSKASISQQEYDNAVLAYVKSKYPRKVKAYNKAKAKARKKLIRDNTLMLDDLMWQDNLDAKSVVRSWQGAKDYCKNLSLAGYSDWRLGNKDEFTRLYKHKNKLKYFYYGYYWSSTSYEGNTYNAWGVFFYNGYVMSYGNKSSNAYVRCVRGGQ